MSNESELCGDATKLRDTLIEIRDICQRAGAGISPLSKRYRSKECQAVNQCFRNAVAALSAPPRNCAVGTVDGSGTGKDKTGDDIGAGPKTTKAKDALKKAVPEAISNYSKATVELFNVLLADNGGKAMAALGGLWIICHNVEHDILRQLRAGAAAAVERKEQQ